jgi:hypothetical protein
VKALYDLNYSHANLGTPLCSPEKIVAIADWARNKWPPPKTFWGPRAQAHRSGMGLLPKRLPAECGKEMYCNGIVAYPATTDVKLMNFFLLHGYAHYIFEQGRFRGNEADVWLLVAELAFPAKLIGWWGINEVIAHRQDVWAWVGRGYARWRLFFLNQRAAE